MSTQRFQIDQVDFNKARPKLLYITESKFDHEWNSTLHTHLYTEMFYVTKGYGLLSLDNKNYPVKEDDLVIVNPLVSHTERGIENVNFEYIVMGIEGVTFFSKEEDEEPRLRFITGGMLSTAELSILQARKEIHLFAERTHRMFGMVQDLLHTEKDDDFNKLFSRIEKYENISDNMELEIANYLNQVSEGRLSSESKLQIRAMLREVTEIESIGDSCYNLARTINRKRQTLSLIHI